MAALYYSTLSLRLLKIKIRDNLIRDKKNGIKVNKEAKFLIYETNNRNYRVWSSVTITKKVMDSFNLRSLDTNSFIFPRRI